MTENPRSRSWFHHDVSLFRDALERSAANGGLRAQLIEKDYYCSILLGDLSILFDDGLVFKGGTCFSKVYNDFFRMSEDLDFSVQISSDATRSQCRAAWAPIKEHLSTVCDRNPFFTLTEEFRGGNENRQYQGRFSYRSASIGESDFIKVEVSLREPLLLQPVIREARTFLTHPDTRAEVISPVSVLVPQLKEAYAEKIRAAVSRKVPAIRDFFDIDHAARNALINQHDPELHSLVEEKLRVSGGDHVDLSENRIKLLREQIESQLRPVVRSRDYQTFDLNRVSLFLNSVIKTS
jgi:predicted nucleotidyltransferase component of viral defense system